ncbi:MAG: glycosyltransferase family 2 protein [Candidatus Helarchaeota archaeon]
MNKIAFIITTFQRDNLLFKSIESLLPHLKENWHVIIVDQGNQSKEKSEWLYGKRVFYYHVPFNSGLSFCRNFGVDIANKLGCNYCVIGSDSFLFNPNIKRLSILLSNSPFDLLGFELHGCKCGWEAKLNLIKEKSFELDFIKKPINKIFYDIDICRNFFIATTKSLLNVQWDNNLPLCEHEDFFWRYKQAGFKCGWTNSIDAEKMPDRPKEYSNFRNKNFQEGMQYLRKKYNILGWVSYKHLERVTNNG